MYFSKFIFWYVLGGKREQQSKDVWRGGHVRAPFIVRRRNTGIKFSLANLNMKSEERISTERETFSLFSLLSFCTNFALPIFVSCSSKYRFLGSFHLHFFNLQLHKLIALSILLNSSAVARKPTVQTFLFPKPRSFGPTPRGAGQKDRGSETRMRRNKIWRKNNEPINSLKIEVVVPRPFMKDWRYGVIDC